MKVFDIVPVKFEDDKMLILDQTKLPGEEVYIEMKTKEDVWDAIFKLKVRGLRQSGLPLHTGFIFQRVISKGQKSRNSANT